MQTFVPWCHDQLCSGCSLAHGGRLALAHATLYFTAVYSHTNMPQQGPKGFRFGHLPKEVRKAVDGYNYLQGGRIPDNRCRPEAQMFMACMFEHTNSVSACRDEIVVLESCIAKLEANPVSEQQQCSQCGRHWCGRWAVLRLSRRRVKM